jgi:uncharacterized surface protein with fasciclin (FAS1) repeats
MIVIVMMVIFFCSGCSDEYFTDGGVLPIEEAGVLNVSTMQYLESKPAQFDTLVKLIKLTGLEGEINKSGNTFLAPQDYSIHNYFLLLYPDKSQWPALSSLSVEEKEAIAQILSNYIIPNQQIERNSLSPAYSFATTSGNRKARFNLVREDYLGNVNMGAAYIMFALDISPEGSLVERYQTVRVVTTDLRSTNGIVHVLDSNTHIFGFN